MTVFLTACFHFQNDVIKPVGKIQTLQVEDINVVSGGCCEGRIQENPPESRCEDLDLYAISGLGQGITQVEKTRTVIWVGPKRRPAREGRGGCRSRCFRYGGRAGHGKSAGRRGG